MNRTDEALVLLLSSVNSDTVAAVTGVLINMSADSRGRVALLTSSDHLLASLANILRKVSFRDIQLCTLICQVIVADSAHLLICELVIKVQLS